nr:phosphonate C-P lyase system protein PhnG [Saccharopolyspora sp. HNM0983]
MRAELLAEAESAELIDLADDCLAAGAEPAVLVRPQVGCVPVQVREPVRQERFLLGDALACRAEVELAGQRGWSLRLGDDRPAALAAAIVDAAARTGLDGGAADRLCQDVLARREAADREEWAELAPTIVEFEEL